MKSLQNLMDLQGRVALVTGGAGHIGAALCEALAELGANVVVLDIDSERCASVVQRIQDVYGVAGLPLSLDLCAESDVQSIPQLVEEAFGRLDILVNCAALVASSDLQGWATPFLEQEADAWRLGLEVNLTVPFVVTKLCSELLRVSKHGAVINISSIYGLVGPDMRLYEDTSMANVASYAASKGGLIQLTRWLATVLAPDVRVNSVSVGGVWRNQPEAFVKRYHDRTPLARMAKEEDLKGAVAYLASDLSQYVTGHNLVVDGGWTAW